MLGKRAPNFLTVLCASTGPRSREGPSERQRHSADREDNSRMKKMKLQILLTDKKLGPEPGSRSASKQADSKASKYLTSQPFCTMHHLTKRGKSIFASRLANLVRRALN
ncbi:unnamed protein product [Eretmochelys imbricata]